MVAGKVEDLTGQVFGRWTVLGRAGQTSGGRRGQNPCSH